ncbi:MULTISPECIES: hypothetical protein [Streptomyces]|uniref:hypothetical protein n=1 Tax=Streptomyces TaxID=1883 RepID=UPI00103997D7|nr:MULTISPECIES: hypothetical protein [Streptomyces]MBT3078445.1 hypothetical protein [Streptomyces sp. COG21]MBT3080685.1 hypothetical protein [Streptomyces sp. COG20]MBT3096271.1 hypothetical protein [Streptomyces sp. CBG30]MBT3107465.1 hypothetical protein [Streptomyces sp. COG19]MBT3109263.1 hypothetical protein [Streptomyces sp. CYG20]
MLRHLLDTGDHDARLRVLVDHQDVAAWGDGHPETAACMALLAVEELAHQVSRVDRSKKHKGLQDVAEAVVSNDDWFPQGQTVLSPLFPLYAQYWAHKGHEVPERLSRHALVHSISLGHLSKGHAIVAIMLMISLLRELQERCDEVRDDMHVNDPEVE